MLQLSLRGPEAFSAIAEQFPGFFLFWFWHLRRESRRRNVRSDIREAVRHLRSNGRRVLDIRICILHNKIILLANISHTRTKLADTHSSLTGTLQRLQVPSPFSFFLDGCSYPTPSLFFFPASAWLLGVTSCPAARCSTVSFHNKTEAEVVQSRREENTSGRKRIRTVAGALCTRATN